MSGTSARHHQPFSLELPSFWRRHEVPTWALIVTIYAGWFAVTWNYDALPGWLVFILGGWLCAWHGSLQHEAVHGHPTRNDLVNELIVFPPLSLWYPYRVYRESHLIHHRDQQLTCPIKDPESCYATPDAWESMGALGRGLRWVLSTLAGRLSVGPFVTTFWLYRSAIVSFRQGDREQMVAWLLHFVGAAFVLTWVIAVCGIPVWAYLLFFAYPGMALTLLRSYAEHRPAEQVGHRTVINEAEWPLAVLFLNNNLHAVHHREPGRPWYELPARFREQRDEVLAENGGFVQNGYRELARRFFVKPKDAPVHPYFQVLPAPETAAAAAAEVSPR